MGTWKSSLALSWKAPQRVKLQLKTKVFDLEMGVHRALTFFDRKNIEVWRATTIADDEKLKDALMFTRGDVLVGRKELWDGITSEYIKTLQRPEVMSIILDTAKELWTANHGGVLQELQEAARTAGTQIRKTLQPVEYSGPNGRMNNFFFLARNFEKDLILINHERDKYVTAVVNGERKEVPSGETELDGYKNTGDLADWAFRTEKQEGGDPIAYIEKSPIGKDLVGMSFSPPNHDSLSLLVSKMQLSMEVEGVAV
jgi:hypothetical protein